MSRSDRGRPPPSAGGTPQGVTEGQVTSKFAGGRGNPPLQRVAESPTPTLRLHFYFSIGTVKTVPYNFSLFIFHYSSIFGAPGRRPLRSHYSLPVPLNAPTNPNLSSCAIAKDLTYKRNHICKSFFAERRRMTKAAGFSNLAAFIVCLHTKRKNPDAYASGISGSRYKTNHLPHLLTTSNAVDGERGKSSFVVSIS